MQCKSLWIKASAKCINVNVNELFIVDISLHQLITMHYEIVFNISWTRVHITNAPMVHYNAALKKSLKMSWKQILKL